ncbi:Gfo/Idh/MocA family oxidoreductase [Mucilaginibacter koreensis]
MASTPIVTGLMAFGMSGKVFHAPFVEVNPNFTLRAVVERNQKNATETYPNVISYNSTEELLNDSEIELIIVNSPNYLHYEQAKAALQAGKHVLLEKPAAATIAEWMDLQEIAKQTGKALMVYQNRRYNSDFISVKEIIESGRLGNLIEVHFRYDRYRAAVGAKKFKEQASYPANGLLYDLGPHLLDQAISLFGKPVSFHKFTAAHREGSEVSDYFTYQLIYPYNLIVNLTASLLAADPGPSYLVHGTAGSFTKDRTDTQEAQLLAGMRPDEAGFGVEADGSEGQLVTIQGIDEKITEQVPAHKANYMHIFDAVYHTIRNGALYPVTHEQIGWQLELLEAGPQS